MKKLLDLVKSNIVTLSVCVLFGSVMFYSDTINVKYDGEMLSPFVTWMISVIYFNCIYQGALSIGRGVENIINVIKGE